MPNRVIVDTWLRSLVDQPGIFVTGTDTGVGKTFVGTYLIRELKKLGLNITPRKPVESGWPVDETQTDAWQLLQAAQLPESALAQVCPYRFKAALAPDRAARLEEKELTLEQLVTATLSHTPQQWLYVEGAGGVYSPIAQDGLNADLAQRLKLPVVLITEDKLGCINHVLMAVEVLQRRGLTVLGVILNCIHPQPNEMDNVTDLQQRLDLPILSFA
ncbi:dethiobiotin synthase [Thiofilum flexile]|uniref:dethiobiotin synthase n=1 Tax=Thiofilum flexile TaxID=125627 RepID=UPI00037150BD|nr:dethiobiotin synthase [Thiofilum flexile]